MSCPVDADTRNAWLALQAEAKAQQAQTDSSSTSTPPTASTSQTPRTSTNESARAQAFLYLRGLNSPNAGPPSPSATSSATAAAPSGPWITGAPHTDMAMREGLSLEREISSIPRARTTPEGTGGTHDLASVLGTNTTDTLNEKWVYPSPAQFYAALARKHSDNPADVADMSVIVPLHNAVNERTWAMIRGWEAQFYPDCLFKDGLKLTTFEGKANEPSWRAWAKTQAGYTPPFDRHDWTVDRCGTPVRYVIDYYAGKPKDDQNPQKNDGVSFYLDVRPAPDSASNLYMRFWRAVRGTPRDKVTA